jgi:hypothetical protein
MQGRPIKASSEQQLSDLRAGKGMSLAVPAEQKSRTQALLVQMQREAKLAGEAVIAAEAALDALFTTKAATPAALRTATYNAAVAQGQLRETHLRYHLAMVELLSPEQVAATTGCVVTERPQGWAAPSLPPRGGQAKRRSHICLSWGRRDRRAAARLGATPDLRLAHEQHAAFDDEPFGRLELERSLVVAPVLRVVEAPAAPEAGFGSLHAVDHQAAGERALVGHTLWRFVPQPHDVSADRVAAGLDADPGVEAGGPPLAGHAGLCLHLRRGEKRACRQDQRGLHANCPGAKTVPKRASP